MFTRHRHQSPAFERLTSKIDFQNAITTQAGEDFCTTFGCQGATGASREAAGCESPARQCRVRIRRRSESRRDGTMAHTYPNVIVHLVFSTKERRNTIPNELQENLGRYFVGIGKGHDIPVLCAGGTANHAHLLIALPATVPLAKAVQVLKANSSRWLGEHGFEFAWQEGYGAFSVSASNVAAVKRYIEHQAEHHSKHSFEDEFESWLRKSGIEYDPQFVFG
jgi:putative transposase